MLTDAGTGARTVIAATPVTVGSTVDAAVICVEPAETAVTTPDVDTVATAVALDDQVTVPATPGSRVTLATSWRVCPMPRMSALGEISTLDTPLLTAVTVTIALALTF